MIDKILVITATLGNRDTLKKTIDNVKFIGGDKVKHILIAPQEKIYILEKLYGLQCIAEPEGRKGIYAALNQGFRTFGTEYKYLTFINDDDYWLPNFKSLINTILDDNKVDLVYGKTQYIDEKGKKIGTQTCSSQFKDFVPLMKEGIVLLTQQSTIIKSDLYFKLSGFDESYKLVADSKFWMQASLLDSIHYKYHNLECAAYMIQEGQLSSDKSTQSFEHIRLLKEFEYIPPRKTSAYIFRLLNLSTYIKRIIYRTGIIKDHSESN